MDEIKNLNYIFTRKQKIETVGMLIMIIVGSALELLGVSTVMPLINSILTPDKLITDHPYDWLYYGLNLKNSNQLVLLLIGILIMIYIIKNIYLIFMYRQQYKFIYSVLRSLSTRMMRCYLDQPYSFHTHTNSSDLLRNINTDTANFCGAVQAFIHLATEGLVVICLIVYLFLKDKTLTIGIGVAISILLLFFMRLFKVKLVALGKNARRYQSQVTKWVQQAFGGIKEVKVGSCEDFFFSKYDEAFAGRVRSDYGYHTMTSIPKPVMEASCMIALLASIAFKIIRGINPEYFVPTMSIFVVAAMRLLPSFNRITEYLGQIAYQKASISAIYKDLKEVEELNARKAQKPAGKEKLELNDRIAIRDLTFRYDDSDVEVIDHVSFDIKKNTSVAFIGQSGAGKTTLADLILGVLTPTGGEIDVDGVNIADSMEGWHKTIGYIPQNIYLMDDTIRNNIAFGIDPRDIDDERLSMAVKRAQLSEFIAELPDGLETMVGERGVRISGGQKQRIGIARALYNEPGVLILDEATSALDNETEEAVMNSIDALHGEMTLIIIAHRLTTIKNCDVVYRIGDGKAVIDDTKLN